MGGSRILPLNQDASTATLHFYDIRSGQDLWRKSLPADAVPLRADDSDLAGVAEPDGNLTVVDLRLAREIFHAQVLPADMEKVNGGLLLLQ
jgi:hypothetical protein